MIYKWLISHQIRESMRSSFWQKQVAINIIIGILLLLMLAYLFILGLFIDKILDSAFPDQDPIHLFNSAVIYYFGIELIIRFFMQSLPVLNLEAYLMLPVRRSSIVHYVAAKSVFSIGNYLSWLIFIPFAVKVIAPRYPGGGAWIWIAGMILLVFSNNFIATYVKRQLAHKAWVAGIFALGLAGLMALDSFHIISVSSASRWLMGGLLDKPYLIVIPVVLVTLAYLVNYFFLKGRLYPDEISVRKQEKADTVGEWRYLKSIGLTGHLISLDLRLMMRHKRTKSIIYMSPIFLLYGLMFYTDPKFPATSVMMVFVGVFMTGGIMISYLNNCFSYESNHFDGLLSRYTDFRQYIRSKYLLAAGVSTISFVLTIPYGLFGTKILLINLATFLYNAGFLSFLILYLATFSTKRMDLSRSASFNYQGMGATHWLGQLPAFLLPVLVLWACNKLGIPVAGYLFLALLGISGIVLHKVYLDIVTRQFMKTRYDMAKGFRE